KASQKPTARVFALLGLGLTDIPNHPEGKITCVLELSEVPAETLPSIY
ncbi:hypothetical protein LEMLEM_LOCUS17556, partial [Lemmus lemmus]